MSDRFRVFSVMGRQLESMGISTKAVLRLAGLPTQLFQQNRIWLTTEEMRALYDDVGYRDLSCYRATRVKTSGKIKTTFGRVLLCTPFSGSRQEL
ncbi:MAG: hypothetical protein ACJ746_20615 [Bryobacteraceae bacterium]